MADNELGRSQPTGGQTSPVMLLSTVDPMSRKVLGFSPAQLGGDPIDLRAVRHPLKWTAWRRRVRRDGPAAAAYDGGPAGRTGTVLLIAMAVLAFAAACAIIAVGH